MTPTYNKTHESLYFVIFAYRLFFTLCLRNIPSRTFFRASVQRRVVVNTPPDDWKPEIDMHRFFTCKSKRSTNVTESKNSSANASTTPPPTTMTGSRRTRRLSSSASSSAAEIPASGSGSGSSSAYLSSAANTASYNNNSWQSSTSTGNVSSVSASTLQQALPDASRVYDFAEIRIATDNVAAEPFSSSSSSTSWRCELRGREVIIFRRKLRRPIEPPDLQKRLSLICRSHHSSLIKLDGVSIGANYIYLVYDYVHGANLSITLRNPRNPSFTVLSSWLSRMQIATDLAHGFDYIHNHTGSESGFVHNRIKSTSIIVVTEPSLNAKICHFGTADLCGEVTPSTIAGKDSKRPSSSSEVKLEGTRGYMAPEFLITARPTKETDVFAFGVVLLELLSGEEALSYNVDELTGGYRRISVIDTARTAVMDGGGGIGGGEVRKWDRRLKDSYPVDVAEKMIRLGLDCVTDDPNARPDMGQIAGRISKLYLESVNLVDRYAVPTDFSISLAPR